MAEDRNYQEDSYRLAEERTDWAEDRTVLANERTFAGWMRTGLAAAALGIGFHALFRGSGPSWLPKLGATFFILIALLLFYFAYRTSSDLAQRLEAHAADPMRSVGFGAIAGLFAFGTLGLGVMLWTL